jgi:hypothetical protein
MHSPDLISEPRTLRKRLRTKQASEKRHDRKRHKYLTNPEGERRAKQLDFHFGKLVHDPGEAFINVMQAAVDAIVACLNHVSPPHFSVTIHVLCQPLSRLLSKALTQERSDDYLVPMITLTI